jgi:dTMP kinase
MVKMSLKPRPINDGFLVVFEGIDGAGKTTQLESVRATLEAEGWPVHATRNLGGTPIGEELRKVIKSPLERPPETNLYISVAIQVALADAIGAERRQGKLILMDRGPLSLAAYEVYGDKLDEALGWQHVEAGLARLRPELTIIYSTDVDTALRRKGEKSGQADYFESKPRDFFERVAEGYQAAARRYPSNTVTIDANQPAETVQAQTMQAVRQALDMKLQAAS